MLATPQNGVDFKLCRLDPSSPRETSQVWTAFRTSPATIFLTDEILQEVENAPAIASVCCLIVAMLGRFLARKGDGEPRVATIRRRLQRVKAFTAASMPGPGRRAAVGAR